MKFLLSQTEHAKNSRALNFALNEISVALYCAGLRNLFYFQWEVFTGPRAQ